MKNQNRTTILLGSLILSACGGGGDGGSSVFTPPTGSFNAALAWQNLIAGTNTWTVSGTGSDGNTYQLNIVDTSAAAGSYPVTGASAQRATSTVTILRNGTQAVQGLTENYSDGSGALLGSRETAASVPTTCTQVTTYAAPPTSAHVGDRAAHYSSNTLDACASGASVTATQTVTWSIEFEAGITYFCSNTTTTELSPASTSTEADCLQVDPSGSLGTRARISVVQPGLTLVLRN